jgi:hypothetical protein
MARWKTLVAAVGVAAVLAACGGGKLGGGVAAGGGTVETDTVGTGAAPAGSATGLLEDAPAKANAAKSAHLHADFSFGAGGQDFGFTIDGASEFSSGKADITMKLDEKLGGGDLHIVGDDQTIYASKTGTTDWIKLDASELSSSGTSVKPGDYLVWLQGASDDVKVVGHESIDGADTTHYQGHVDMTKIASNGGASSAQVDAAKQLGLDSMPLDVWLDGDGLPRRILIDTTFEVSGQQATFHMQVDMSDYGAAVEVTIPPAGDIRDGTAADLQALFTS